MSAGQKPSVARTVLLVAIASSAAAMAAAAVPARPGAGEPIPIPFVRQRGNSCVQAQLHMVLSYFHQDREWNLADLDRRTGRGPGQWTWLPQIMSVLEEEGIDARLFSTLDYPNLRKEKLARIYPHEIAQQLKRVTNWQALRSSIDYLTRASRFERRRLRLADLEKALASGHVTVVIVDSSILNRHSDAGYQGHAVTITAIDDERVHYHDSSRGPNQTCRRKRFEAAWDAPGTDNDTVIIEGLLPPPPEPETGEKREDR